jgi:hypothetical protein
MTLAVQNPESAFTERNAGSDIKEFPRMMTAGTVVPTDAGGRSTAESTTSQSRRSPP